MTKWEYKIADPLAGPALQSVGIADIQAWLNYLGAAGWELIHIGTRFYTLKRPAGVSY